jgi:hypothetical protein
MNMWKETLKRKELTRPRSVPRDFGNQQTAGAKHLIESLIQGE